MVVARAPVTPWGELAEHHEPRPFSRDLHFLHPDGSGLEFQLHVYRLALPDRNPAPLILVPNKGSDELKLAVRHAGDEEKAADIGRRTSNLAPHFSHSKS